MSTFDVLRQFGTAALLRHTAAVVLFLILHLARLPLVILAAVLEGVIRRVDDFATRQASQRPKRPVNQWFPDNTAREAA